MPKKRISTLIGLLILIIGAVSGVMLLDQNVNFLPRAAPEYIPQKVKITNINDSSFTISWITQEPTIGFVKLGLNDDSLDTTSVDERDQLTGSSGEYRSHYITAQGLQPNTTYYFKLGSQDQQLYDDHNQPFSVTTAPSLGSIPPSDTAYGSVYTPADTPAEGAVVYLALENATPLSALVKQDGSWAVSLSQARSIDLSSYASYDDSLATISLYSQGSSGETAQITTTTNNDQPVPDIILGENVDFQNNTDQVLSPNANSDQASKFSLSIISVTEPETASSDVTIKTLPQDGTSISQSRPTIEGTAPPNTTLTISIHSNQIYTESLSVDPSGQWSWTPPGNLDPGEHNLTISYTDQEGILHTLQRSFVVLAAAETQTSPSYTASPSAALTPTSTPPPASPTPEPTTTPPTTPPNSPSPTTTPTSLPSSPTPTTTRVAIPDDTTPQPQSGNSFPTFLLSLIGFILIVTGFKINRQSTRTS